MLVCLASISLQGRKRFSTDQTGFLKAELAALMLQRSPGEAACANFSPTGRLPQEGFRDNRGGFEESEEQPVVEPHQCSISASRALFTGCGCISSVLTEEIPLGQLVQRVSVAAASP